MIDLKTALTLVDGALQKIEARRGESIESDLRHAIRLEMVKACREASRIDIPVDVMELRALRQAVKDLNTRIETAKAVL